MERRGFVKLALTSSVVISGGAIGWSLLRSPRSNAFQSIEQIISFLDALPQATNIESSGNWTPNQIFSHLNQSIEFSLNGFPEYKSELFQSTIGKLVLHVFNVKGAMTHNLSGAFPGADELRKESDLQSDIVRFSKNLRLFLEAQQLAPHFIFGELTKEQYARAHVMHINDHFSELMFKSS